MLKKRYMYRLFAFIFFNLLTLLVMTNRLEAQCTYTINPTGQSFSITEGIGGVNVTTQAGCPWDAISNDSWVTVNSNTGGFVSDFTSDAGGWNVQSGTWSLGTGWYNATGASSSYASVSHDTDYGTLDYRVRMKREVESDTVNSIAIRGVPLPLDVDNRWDQGYDFGYVNAGQFRVIKYTGAGSYVWLQNWTVSNVIIQNDWNELRVTANGQNLEFYINNTLVWQGTDPTFSTGKVGVGMYAVSATDTLHVDWATLGTTVGAVGTVTGNGTVIYTVAANSGAARTGTMTIGGQTFTVTQDGAVCTYALDSAGQSFDFSGGVGNIAVTSAGFCAWSAASNDAWIIITSGSPGTGNGTVAYWVAANSGGARTGTMTIGGQTFTVTQTGSGDPCAYTLTPTSQSFTALKGNGNIGVAVPNGCAWSAASNAYWITVPSGAGGNGNGVVNYSVAANNGTISRSGTITVGGQTFTVTQDKPTPITCTESPVRILQTALTYGTLQEAYDAASDNDTIQVQAVSLIGNLTVNQNISVTLAGGYSCDFGTDTGLYTILKGAVQTLPGGGALAIVNVNIKPNVLPPVVTTGAVTNNAADSATLNGTVNPRSAATTYYFEWGTTTGYGTRNPLTPASAGTGAADVPVSVSLTGLTPNTAYHYRLVAENVEGITNGLDGAFTTPCVFTVSPLTAIVLSSSAGYSATVTANAGCGWTAVSNVPAWITISSGTPGTGNGTLNYTVGANPGMVQRTGTLTIAGQTLTVVQDGTPCSYSLTSASQSFGNWGGTGSVGVTAVGGCAWSGQSNVPWITITSGANGVGSGTVNYSVAANSGASTRSGTMTIGGSTFTVNQAAGPLSCAGSPVRNLNTLIDYASLQAAYNAALNGHTLRIQGIPITGNLTVNRNITVTMEGGYTCDFGTYAGINTPLTGSITTTSPGGGTLIIKNFQLQ